VDNFIPSPAVLRRLDRRIAACEAVIARTQRILDRPFEAVGSYVTGGTHRPRSLDRQLDAENNRRGQAYQQNTRARSELALLQTRRELYVRGEVHENGQPRAAAPSRQQRAVGKAALADFYRTLLKPGDTAGLICNAHTAITIKRLNAKSITDAQGVTWDYADVVPFKDGRAMTLDELKTELKAWRSAQLEKGN
jgi:hypothetical protein